MNEFVTYIVENNLGDIASVLGVLITFIGFIITIYNVLKSKRIILKVRKDIRFKDAIFELGNLIRILEDIQRYHREKKWELAINGYVTARKIAISIKNSSIALEIKYKNLCLGIIQHLRDMENELEESLHQGVEYVKMVHINRILSSQLDRLQEFFIDVKTKVGY